MPDHDPYAARRMQEIQGSRAEELNDVAPPPPVEGRPVDLDTTLRDDETAHLDPAAVAACKRCDADGYTPAKTICDHQDHAAAAARHMPEIREILTRKDSDD